MPKYIDFVKNNSDNSWSVVNKKSGLEPGVIEWYNRWRRFIESLNRKE